MVPVRMGRPGVRVFVLVPDVTEGVPVVVDEVGGEQNRAVRQDLLGGAGGQDPPVFREDEDPRGGFPNNVQVAWLVPGRNP